MTGNQNGSTKVSEQRGINLDRSGSGACADGLTVGAGHGVPLKSQVPNLHSSVGTSHQSSALNLAAVRVLRLESDLRKIRTLEAWGLFIANETRQVTQSQQTFVFRRGDGRSLRVVAASSIANIDRSSPLVAWMEAIVKALNQRLEIQTAHEFDASSMSVEPGIDLPAYPLRFMFWLPFLDLDGQVIGGMLQTKTRPWIEAEIVLSKHVADACAHALIALGSNSMRLSRLRAIKARHIGFALAAFFCIGLLPVFMTALAPVEVVPKGAFVVTAPIEGVVDRVLVAPNEHVKKGQVLLRFSDTVLRNRLEIAEREMLVAEAKLKKAGQLAFVDARGRHELGIAQAELELRKTERDYASELLERSVLKADREGVAIFSDPKDLVGRPVAVGERLMEVADPSEVEFRIDLPVSDAIVIREGARVKVFLDSDPLGTIEARLVRADFQARVRENQVLAFRLIATGVDLKPGKARLGVRGTAQVYSDRVSLMLYLFRRPFSAVRQWIGV